MQLPVHQPGHVIKARAQFRRPSRSLVTVLGMVLVAWAAVSPSGGDPPPQQAPGQQHLSDLLSQLLPGAKPERSEASADSDPATPAAEPLSSSSVSTTDAGLIEVHVRDAEITALLEMLSYQARANIVASKSVHGTVSANLYGLTLPEALDAILTPNGYAYLSLGRTLFVGTPGEIAAQLPPPETRVFTLRYIAEMEALTAVRALLSPTGSAVAGGADDTAGSTGKGKEYEGEASIDYLIVTDTPDRLEAVGRLLEQIDLRPRQVLIEATILRATLNENNEFGIDFTLLGGMDFQNVTSVSNTTTDVITGPTPPPKFEKTTFNLNTDLIGQFPEGGFTFGIIRNNVATFVRALEEVTDVAVVANPKIIALNKQEAEVIVGRRDGYLTTTVTETAAIQTVEFLETGTQVRFCPTINEDGTVRLFIHPKDSNGGLTTANLPFEETTEARATILVNDGHTVLIGGLFRERTVGSKGQVPLLGNIPLAGLLFQRSSDQTVREEVIILLTVHVLKENADEYERYAALLEDVERIRVGTRRGLLGSGRERLAQAFYQEAIRQAEQGSTGRALLNTRMALHNHPKHLAALKLKERLLGRRLWDDEGTRMRLFLLDLIREEQPSRAEANQSQLLGRPPLDLQLQREPAVDEAPGAEAGETP
jgi:type IV pilus assembly protein PilQ